MHVVVDGRGEGGESQAADDARLNASPQTNQSSSDASSVGAILPVRDAPMLHKSEGVLVNTN